MLTSAGKAFVNLAFNELSTLVNADDAQLSLSAFSIQCRLRDALKLTLTLAKRGSTMQPLRRLHEDEAGFIISAELVLVMTIGVLAMVVGLTAVRDSVTHEMNDISHAVGAVSQSYNVTGLHKGRDNGWGHACLKGFGFNDSTDECDCHVIELVDVCGKDDPSDGDDE